MSGYPPPVRLVRLPPQAMRALVAGDRETASAAAGVVLSEFLASEECTWLWQIRLVQIAADPDIETWVARAVVSEAGQHVVGHAGFHGPPDLAGMVEVGYTVDPRFRRQGYAKAMLRELLSWATAESRVTTVRASIRPDNVASLATIEGFGFERTGEQWDEDDGLETIFEVKIRKQR
ncbi:MAG TPA: GNAT family N-acetyltransferase [Nocardioidaceae bacterium]|nr:GNAT family N-acetyltransferase [Nocardioidaceae bacterium]